jgi:ATP-dependent RNA helicase DeaD
VSEIPADPASSIESSPVGGFRELGLDAAVLQALAEVGYEVPTPIQAATIPALLAGSDVLGQAQTGTGKTAAFALPLLSRIDLTRAQTQALVLVPTRELALQVAEAFQSYATHLKSFHVLPVYGGQSYTPQMRGLKRGAHVVVGTPGRIMDHMKRGTLELTGVSVLVLDEADEMLQMGFVDDIEWILEQTPPERQVALFSATLPAAIRRIAQRHLRSPAEITIQSKTNTAANIRQRYWLVSGVHKLDALTRILEAEVFDAMLVFVRTKLETVELAERLQARGFDAAALNGDIPQQQRERTINALKAGEVDIVVATDVAARGLDVERVSHVVNYDIPYDSESYIHRIGRTGRAGRKGEAILFVAPRERNMLRIIEKATRQRIAEMDLPSIAAVNEQRVARFKQRLGAALTAGEGAVFRELIEEFEREQNVPAIDIAAALASLLHGSAPLLLSERAGEGPRAVGEGDRPRGREEREPRRSREERGGRPQRGRGEPERRGRRAERGRGEFERRGPSAERGRGEFEERGRSAERGRGEFEERGPRAEREERERAGPEGLGQLAEGGLGDPDDRGRQAERGRGELEAEGGRNEAPARGSGGGQHKGEGGERDAPAGRRRRRADAEGVTYERFRVEVGHVHGVKPGNIVGAIANEAGLEGRYIGHVDIREDHSFVDLPEGMPKEIFRSLKKVRVAGRELRIARGAPARGATAHGAKARHGAPGRK